MKKKLAFLLGITPNLSFAAGNVAIGINKYMSNNNYDIVIFYTELPEKDILAFSKIPHVTLKQFELPKSFVHTFLESLPKESRFREKNKLMCFAHFEVFSLLENYENVAWIDVDTSIQKDLSTIINFSNPIGITKDTPWKVRDQFIGDIDEYNLDIEGYCTAVMVANDSLPYKEIYGWLYKKALQYAALLKNPDQAIISIMLQEFNIKPICMPLEEWQCISWKREAATARIVHFGTENKIWNDSNICNAFPEWYRNHEMWLEIGGSDFNKNILNFHNILGELRDFEKNRNENKDRNRYLKQIYNKSKVVLKKITNF